MIRKLYVERNRKQMLHTNGSRIEDEYGREVLLSGVNCASLEWDPHPDHLMRTIRAAYDEWKSNLIRLPLLPNGWYGYLKDQPVCDPDGEKYRDFVDELVNEAAKRGKYILLDLHGCNVGELGVEDYGPMPDMVSLRFWTDLANRYKNHPNVLFGLFNEPRDIDWEIWRDGGMITADCVTSDGIHTNTFETPGMKRIFDCVRETGAKNITVLGGLDWSFSWEGSEEYLFEDTEGNGIVLDTHIYPWKSFDWNRHIGCVSGRFPVIVGECGHSGEHRRPENPQKGISSVWVPRLLNYIRAERFHVTAWDFHDEASPCLVKNLTDYTPTPFWGDYFKAFLAERAQPMSCRQTQIEVNVTERSVRFFGRTVWDVLENGVFFNWSGSGFEFRFTGTEVWAELWTDLRDNSVPKKEDQAHIAVYTDGSACASSRFLLDKEHSWYPLVRNLPYGEHTVRVVKASEAGYGRAGVTKLKAYGTMQPLPTEEKDRKMEVIGDSISCGYGNICSDASPEFVTWEQNSEETYAAMLAKRFDAEMNWVCASGNGVTHDYGCNTHNMIPEMYRYEDKMLHEHYGKQARKWDFYSYRPQVILIKLGSNDARYCDGWDFEDEAARTEELKMQRREEFFAAYQEFLKEVRELNPDSEILCFWENTTVLRDWIRKAVETVAEETEDGRLHALEILSKQPEESVGANGHWSVCTHRRCAGQLAEEIKKITGWD